MRPRQHKKDRATDLDLFPGLFPSAPRFAWTGKKALERHIKAYRFTVLRRIMGHGDFQALCAAVGWVELVWSQYEQNLDHWSKLIFQTLGGRGVNASIPRSLSEKTKFLRRCFRRISILHPFTDEALAILDRGVALSQTRHDLTHGTPMHTEAIDGTYKFATIRHTADDHIYGEYLFNSRDFPKLAQNLLALARDAGEFGLKLLALVERLEAQSRSRP